MKIAHISDIHYITPKERNPLKYINKRITGLLNLVFVRSRIHNPLLLDLALNKIRQNADVLAVTGDLTNLAFDSEFCAVRKTLNKYFDDDKMLIVPGNHDRYLKKTITEKTFEKHFGTPHAKDTDNPWPFLKIIDDCAFIGVDSVIDFPPFYSAGKISRTQIKIIKQWLQSEQLKDKNKILLLHHHPVRNLNSPGEHFRKLRNNNELLKIAKRFNINLILHGHNHTFKCNIHHNTLIAENGSLTVAKHKNPEKLGRFTIYTFNNNEIIIDTWKYNPKENDFLPGESYAFNNATLSEIYK